MGQSWQNAAVATIHLGDVRIEVPTKELGEALRQLGLLRPDLSIPPAPPPRQKTIDDELPPGPPPPKTDAEMALDFLRVIAEAEGIGGAPIEAVMRALGAIHAKGVGSKAAVVNKLLDKAGFAIPDVYSNPRDSYGDRYWRAGPRLQDAMDALSAAQGNQPDDDALRKEG